MLVRSWLGSFISERCRDQQHRTSPEATHPGGWQCWNGPFFYLLQPTPELQKLQTFLAKKAVQTISWVEMFADVHPFAFFVAISDLRFVAFLVPAGYVDDAPLNLSNIHILEICSLSRRQCLGASFILLRGDVIPKGYQCLSWFIVQVGHREGRFHNGCRKGTWNLSTLILIWTERNYSNSGFGGIISVTACLAKERKYPFLRAAG